jgi:hypothetical protein
MWSKTKFWNEKSNYISRNDQKFSLRSAKNHNCLVSKGQSMRFRKESGQKIKFITFIKLIFLENLFIFTVYWKNKFYTRKYLGNAKKTYYLPSDGIKIQGALQNDFLKEQFLQIGLKRQELVAKMKFCFQTAQIKASFPNFLSSGTLNEEFAFSVLQMPHETDQNLTF